MMETGDQVKQHEENCHEFDLPVMSNVEKVLVEHLVLDLTSTVVSKSFEGTATYFIQPVKLCEADLCIDNNSVLTTSDKNISTVLPKTGKTTSSPHCKCQCHSQLSDRAESNTLITIADEMSSKVQTSDNTVNKLDLSDNAGDTCTVSCDCTGTDSEYELCTANNDIENEDLWKPGAVFLPAKIEDEHLNVTNVCNNPRVPTCACADLFEFILDCSDIEVISAEEVFHPRETESENESLWQDKNSPVSDHKNYKTCSLPYSVEKWCVKIRKPGVVFAEDFPRCIKLRYKTKPCGASLKWCSDQDGKLCVFTHGHWINNRSLFPGQDSPITMATWEASIHVPDCYVVLMSGDQTVEPSLESNGFLCYKYFTTMKMPASTLALAIGQWNHVTLCEPITSQGQRPCLHHPHGTCTVHYSLTPILPCRLFAPDSLIQRAVSEIGDYIPRCMKAAHKVLGNHPFYRLDILVVPKCFASLALACPSMMMISQTLLPGDQSVCIRLAHELSHSWFGLLIGALDWTEEWLTEGFATYLEDCIHGEAMQWDSSYKNDYFELRAALRHRNLSAEMMTTDEELQVLRPATETNQSAEGSTVYIKHGMNPNKTFTQVHYLKGYFLLRHLSHLIGIDQLGSFIKQFVDRFHGQFVSSQNVLENLFETFTTLREQGVSVESLYRDWLDTPGMPQPIKQLTVSVDNRLIKEVHEEFSQWKPLLVRAKHRTKGTKRKKCHCKKDATPSTSQLVPDQLVLLLEMFLETEHCPASVLAAITDRYSLCTANADVRHRWCELIVKLRCNKYYQYVTDFLMNDQAMGVYLFGELIISEDRKQRQLAELCFKEISADMEEGPYKVVSEMLYGHRPTAKP